jgi:very-short-patch-repair endonuclease
MKIDIQRDRARFMRKSMPQAEVILWSHLRRRNLGGFRFQRQVEIGPFIVDFLCRERKLVIEVDGATHSEPAELAHDKKRAAFLTARGYQVFRCTNEDIYRNLDGVLDSILAALEALASLFSKR